MVVCGFFLVPLPFRRLELRVPERLGVLLCRFVLDLTIRPLKIVPAVVVGKRQHTVQEICHQPYRGLDTSMSGRYDVHIADYSDSPLHKPAI